LKIYCEITRESTQRSLDFHDEGTRIKQELLADFFTKPLAKDRFNYLKIELGILDYSNTS